jgi:DNA-binding transcriptional MerR regulator
VSTVEKTLRIGELAELAGTTPRTIRYYEEIGLLGSADDRDQGKHRSYTQADLDRVKEILRLRDLLGLSLEQLSQLLEAETARAEIRREYRQSEDPDTRRRLLGESLGHIATQLKLVRGRRRELEQLEQELVNKQREVSHKLKRLGG